MSATEVTVRDGELTAVSDPDDDAGPWEVWRGHDVVGVLEQRRAGGTAWVVGRIGEDLVAEGPTALSVLRRLSCRASGCSSPVRT